MKIDLKMGRYLGKSIHGVSCSQCLESNYFWTLLKFRHLLQVVTMGLENESWVQRWHVEKVKAGDIVGGVTRA